MGVVGTPPPSLHLSLSRSLEGILKHPGQTLGNLQVKPCETPCDGAMLVYTPPNVAPPEKLIPCFYRQHRGSNPGPLACASSALHTGHVTLLRPNYQMALFTIGPASTRKGSALVSWERSLS